MEEHKYQNLLQTKLNDSDFNKYCLNPLINAENRTDCVINTLYFLNLINKITGLVYSDITNDKGGFTIEETIRFIINKLYIKYYHSCYTNITAETLDDMFKYYNLKESYGTIAFFFRKKGVGHAVAIVKHPSDYLLIADLQQEKVYYGDEIQQFLTEQGFISICLLFEREKRIISPYYRVRKTKEKHTRKKQNINITPDLSLYDDEKMLIDEPDEPTKKRKYDYENKKSSKEHTRKKQKSILSPSPFTLPFTPTSNVRFTKKNTKTKRNTKNTKTKTSKNIDELTKAFQNLSVSSKSKY